MSGFERAAGTMTRRGALRMAAGSFAAGAASPLLAQPASAGWSEIDAIAGKAVAEKKVPGVAISVMKQGKLLYSKGYGFANLETRTPVQPQSVFRIGSLAKQFTAVGILLLAEEGRLSIDDRLSRFLPDFPRSADITIRQMLGHTSGLGSYTNSKDMKALQQQARTDRDEQAMMAVLLAADPLFAFEPGTKWAYSNSAYVLLGFVIEKASGMPYSRYLQERLLTPLALSQIAVDDSSEAVLNRVSGYTPDPASPTGFDNAGYISMTFAGAGGAMRSTADDLCRWQHALLAGKVLKPASLTAMLTPSRLSTGELPSTVAKDAASPRIPIEYGLGIGMATFDGQRTLEHTGGMFGFGSLLRTFPAERLTIACTSNSDGNNLPLLNAMMKAARQAAMAL